MGIYSFTYSVMDLPGENKLVPKVQEIPFWYATLEEGTINDCNEGITMLSTFREL